MLLQTPSRGLLSAKLSNFRGAAKGGDQREEVRNRVLMSFMKSKRSAAAGSRLACEAFREKWGKKERKREREMEVSSRNLLN